MKDPYPCSHAYLHYIDSDGNSRCDECDRVVASVECVCDQRPAWGVIDCPAHGTVNAG